MEPTWTEVHQLSPETCKFSEEQIKKAIERAKCFFSSECFDKEEIYKEVVMYMAAHLLVSDAKTGAQDSGPVVARRWGPGEVRYAQTVNSDQPPALYRGTRFGLRAWGLIEAFAPVLPFTLC